MTSFRVARFPFDECGLKAWRDQEPRRALNWPVVYAIDGSDEIYVGETLHAIVRLRQHRAHQDRKRLTGVRIIVDEKFNKSVCLDLESFLIRLLSGEGRFAVLNRNDGITDADYYNRDEYQETFREIFDQLRGEGLFQRTIPEIENSELFKLSPFKALTPDQAIAVEDILEGLTTDLERGVDNTIVIEGAPGTGKTILAVYLVKLLRDIASSPIREDLGGDSLFSDFFSEGYQNLLGSLRIGLVVPQQALRASVRKVFQRTPGLEPSMVVDPFHVGEADDDFDLLIVDEAHRLSQRASLASGAQNARFPRINQRLFGRDDPKHTQLDWIVARSRHRILLVDAEQTVRPSDLSSTIMQGLVDDADSAGRRYPLKSQMRVRAGDDYVRYVRRALSDDAPGCRAFPGYDLRFFDDLGAMRREILRREDEHGLSRLVAGYAWPWVSRKDPSAFDIELDGARLRWNSSDADWVSRPQSRDEVGSIHTVQGYDLNYAGVIIGPDLGWDVDANRLVFRRDQYHDKKGKQNNRTLGIAYTDDDLLRYVRNIYAVLATRGILGTYVYVVDPELRERLRPLLGGDQPA